MGRDREGDVLHPTSNRGDRRGVLTLVGIGTLATNILMLCLWSWWAFGTHNGFADMSVDMLKDPNVRGVVADQIVDVLDSQPMTEQTALAARPVLKPVVAEIVNTDAFKGLFYAGAHQLHETIFLGVRSRMLVHVDDAGQMVKESLDVANPELADKIPDDALDIAVGLSQDRRLDTVVRTASYTGWMLWPLGAIAIGSFATALILSRDPRRTVLRIGVALMASGLFWIVVLIVGVAVVSRMVDGTDDRAALRAVFRSVTHVFMLIARVVFSAGIVITIAALVAGEERIRAQVREALEWAKAEWSMPKVHGFLGALIIVVGVLVVAYPEVVVAVVARSIGLVLAFIGLVAVLDVVGARGWSGSGDGRQSQTLRHVAVVGTASCASIAILLTFGGFTLYRSLHDSHAVAPDPDGKGCNGYVELCDRRLDDVVLAATHNSMSAKAEPDWWFARQTGGIGAQLAKGVRAFLIDAHYGTRIGGMVRTDFGSVAERAAANAELSAVQSETLYRTFGVVGWIRPPDSEPEVFLCHVYCELGATPAVEALKLLNGFLKENPNEVVVLIIEDHVSATDFESAVRASGVDRRAFHYRPGTPLPTLRTMIESQQNVVLMAENEAGGADWYPNAYDGLLEDTTYKFDGVEDFTCATFRGDVESPLFLMNHWLSGDPASQTEAENANSRAVLVERVDRCRVEQDRVPNLIAVDFYSSGDVFTVVNELNGVGAAPG
jgi:hypothetical protein